jgi:hypothetical protein
VVNGDALLEVPAGCRPFSDEEQDVPEHDMGIAEVYWVVNLLGQAEHVLRQLAGSLELLPIYIKFSQAY